MKRRYKQAQRKKPKMAHDFLTQKRTVKPVDTIPKQEFSKYSRELKATSRSAADVFKQRAELELKQPHATEKELQNALYHIANDTFEEFADATGTASCNFFESYIEGARQVEIAPIPKYIKKRLYEGIERYGNIHGYNSNHLIDIIARSVGTEVYHHANRTTKYNAIRNGLRYARVPRGGSCAFCLMLASRGFVYHSKTSAGEDKGHYHNNCHCAVVAGNLKMRVNGYDPDGLNERMTKLAASLDIDDWMAAAADKELTKVLNRELANRDKRWVLNGKVPEVEYENKLAKKNVHPHEIEQAKRLAQHGIKCVFQVDYEVDEKTKGTARQKTIGKTDLANGIELKSLRHTTNLRKRIEKELRNSRDKKGFKSCHFDAYDTDFDEKEISKALKDKMKQVHVRRSSFIDPDGQYHVVQVNK